MPNVLDKCPCGTGQTYSNCCQPLHAGAQAATPEALMRSRYSAFVLQLSDYLLASWHSSSRPPSLRVEDSPTWKALHVLSSSQQQTQGRVHFRALYKEAKHWGFLEEESQFVQEQGHWYYLTGTTREGQLKPGRNDPCPCGSGKKYKACCV